MFLLEFYLILPEFIGILIYPYGIPRQTKSLPFWSKLPSICSVCSNLLLRLPRSMLGEPCVAQVRAKPLASLLCWPCCSLAYLGIAFRSFGRLLASNMALSYSVPPSQDVTLGGDIRTWTLFKQYVPDMTESHGTMYVVLVAGVMNSSHRLGNNGRLVLNIVPRALLAQTRNVMRKLGLRTDSLWSVSPCWGRWDFSLSRFGFFLVHARELAFCLKAWAFTFNAQNTTLNHCPHAQD